LFVARFAYSFGHGTVTGRSGANQTRHQQFGRYVRVGVAPVAAE
jgi:hypothetical protein